MTAIKFGSELTFIGATNAVAVRRLPLITLPWYVDEGPAVLMGRNGRPRQPCTLPGYRAGIRPANEPNKPGPRPKVVAGV